MLNVIISDSVKKSMIRLSDMVKTIIYDHQMDADIKLVTLDQRNIFKVPVEETEPCLFILEFNTANLHIYQKINEVYKDSSVLFYAGTINEAVLRASLSGNIRPSGFIEKPVSIQEFSEIFLDIYAVYDNRVSEQADTLNVSASGRIYRVSLKNIVYFESLGKKINVIMKSQCISYYDSLQNLESTYSDAFTRCHKSFLVNTSRIREALFNDMELVMDNGAKIPISRTYKNNVKEAMQLMPKNVRVVSNN